MANTILNKQVVRIISGSAGHSDKKDVDYAILKYKTSRWFEGMEYIAPASKEIMDLVAGLDDEMGQEITLVTSIEL